MYGHRYSFNIQFHLTCVLSEVCSLWPEMLHGRGQNAGAHRGNPLSAFDLKLGLLAYRRQIAM